MNGMEQTGMLTHYSFTLLSHWFWYEVLQIFPMSTLSCLVDEILNRKLNSAAPFVGMLVFAHNGGLHMGAIQKYPLSCQHLFL